VGAGAGAGTYCWGVNFSGELGNGGTANSDRPVLVSSTAAFVRVYAGGNATPSYGYGGYTCGVTASGGAYCWGYNAFGQLGDGTTTDHSTPMPVSLPTGVSGFVTMSAGTNYTCAATASGDLYCWGYNGQGQFGNGTTTSSSVPVPVPRPQS
jgi:alpha-tubulin suppressor-like RCC1 family protein